MAHTPPDYAFGSFYQIALGVTIADVRAFTIHQRQMGGNNRPFEESRMMIEWSSYRLLDSGQPRHQAIEFLCFLRVFDIRADEFSLVG